MLTNPISAKNGQSYYKKRRVAELIDIIGKQHNLTRDLHNIDLEVATKRAKEGGVLFFNFLEYNKTCRYFNSKKT